MQITEVELVHCDNVNNGSQKDSIVLCKFFSDKSFNLLWNISPKNFIFKKTLDSKFSYIEVFFNDENSELLEMEDKLNTISIIN